MSQPALACDTPICEVDPDTLGLDQVITFDDLPSSFGVGREVPEVLVRKGAQFGERFAGQILTFDGDYDRAAGGAMAPLTVLPGVKGQNLGILRLMATSVLHGHGPAGFPNPQAAGEGSVAILFDHDQSAVGFDIRGGEGGAAFVTFLKRDGTAIGSLTIAPLSEKEYGFRRSDDTPDIAGMLIENADPEGIALDNVRFREEVVLGLLAITAQP
ncbi:hypothetical protein [Shimia biformata]|uniref:hypothetical protein n=1 Tax=Shimia biformata TaxID=1294299 RepID=UPI001EF183A3|nr:hypothetical protein [Shimia biformata]